MKNNNPILKEPTQEEVKENNKRHQGMVPINQEKIDTFQKENENRPRESEIVVAYHGLQQKLLTQKIKWIEVLERTPIKQAIKDWISHLRPGTALNYSYYINDFIRRGIIPEYDAEGNEMDVGLFNQMPHEHVIDCIKKMNCWAESTRQMKAACYISFTSYLHRISKGWFRKAIPSRRASNPTFFPIRDKCKTKALTLAEAKEFIEELERLNSRDALMAKCMLQGAKRLSEVINLKIDQVEFDKNILRFKQTKTGGIVREIPITYPDQFMQDLKDYISRSENDRGDLPYVFVTRNQRPLTNARLQSSFHQTSIRLGWWRFNTKKKVWEGKKITPHVMRTTWVTLAKKQGYEDSEIMRVTGHSSSRHIYAYDKTSVEENPSKTMILV